MVLMVFCLYEAFSNPALSLPSAKIFHAGWLMRTPCLSQVSLSKSKSQNGSSPRHPGASALVESEVDNVQPSQIG